MVHFHWSCIALFLLREQWEHLAPVPSIPCSFYTITRAGLPIILCSVEYLYHVRLNTYTLEKGRQRAAMLKAEGKKGLKGIKFFYN
ncbi:MAG: hypothetical protein F6K17_15555 [Okeania sp. SIO3C4]|nr:hypothetical protein [Okeania sp. SIO3C4]